MSLITIVVTLAVVGLILWAITQIPMDPTIARVIRILVVVFVCLWLLQQLGLLGSFDLRLR